MRRTAVGIAVGAPAVIWLILVVQGAAVLEGFGLALVGLLLMSFVGVPVVPAVLRGERAKPFMDLTATSLVIHHPAFFTRPVVIPMRVVNSVCVDEMSREPPRSRGDTGASRVDRVRRSWRELERHESWLPPISPHVALPDVFTVASDGSSSSEEPWNLLVLLREPFYLGTLPRRTPGWLAHLWRGSFLAHAPERGAWVRGFLGRLEDVDAAMTAFKRAGIGRSPLGPEVIAWAARPPSPRLRDLPRLLRVRPPKP